MRIFSSSLVVSFFPRLVELISALPLPIRSISGVFGPGSDMTIVNNTQKQNTGPQDSQAFCNSDCFDAFLSRLIRRISQPDLL